MATFRLMNSVLFYDGASYTSDGDGPASFTGGDAVEVGASRAGVSRVVTGMLPLVQTWPMIPQQMSEFRNGDSNVVVQSTAGVSSGFNGGFN